MTKIPHSNTDQLHEVNELVPASSFLAPCLALLFFTRQYNAIPAAIFKVQGRSWAASAVSVQGSAGHGS